MFGALDAEIAHELTTDGAVAEDIHLFCQVYHLFRHQVHQVFHHLGMVLAGIGAAFGDVLLLDEEDGAVLFADDDEFIFPVGKGKGCPKNTGMFQIFQHIQGTIDADAVDRNGALQQQADKIPLSIIGGDDILLGLLPHIKAGHHLFDAFGRNIFKQRVF